VGRYSSVGIATGYGLDGPRIEFQWRTRFSLLVQTGPGAHPANKCNGFRVFVVDEAAGMWCLPTATSSEEVKERAELYLYSLKGIRGPF